MTNEKMDLKGLAAELDNASGGLGAGMETLEDIKTNLLLLVEDMDEKKGSSSLQLRFDEWHRELRILSKLMYHAMESTKEEQQNIKYLSEGFFDEIVRNKK